jgi:hypothetical protein
MGESVTVLLERRAPITLRLAALLALTDLSTVIEEPHLVAALAWADYHRDSVRFVFGSDAKQRQEAMVTQERRDKVLAALRASRSWVGRSDLTKQVFRGHIKADELTAVFQALLADGEIERKEQPNPNNPGTKTLYRAAPAKTAKTAKTGVDEGLHGLRNPAKAAKAGTTPPDYAGYA